MKKFVLPLIALTAHSAVADQHLETTVVTATRTEQKLSEVLAPVTVITREQIELMQAVDLTDILITAPGINIAQNGGPGSNTSVFMRGGESDHTLVLINGQRIASATNGTAAIQHISAEQIEQIEIIRGPRASLYGADAMSGVINIITRKSHQDQARIVATTGSNDTQKIALGIDKTFGKTTLTANLESNEVQEFDRVMEATKESDKDNDTYERLDGQLMLSHEFSANHKLALELLNSDGESTYDDDWAADAPYNEFKVQTTRLQSSNQLNKDIKLETTLSQSKNESENFDDNSGISTGFFNTEINQVSLLSTYKISENQIFSLGAEHYEIKVDSSTNYSDTEGNAIDSLDNSAIFAAWGAAFDSISTDISLREDDHERYGNKTTGSVALGFDVAEDLSVITSYGTAFKAPNFNELFWPGYGNPDLNPEKSETLDLGFKAQLNDSANWRLNIFRSKVTDLISAAQNIDKANLRGIELSVNVNANDWLLNSAFSIVSAKDADTNEQLSRRPKYSFDFSLDKHLHQLTIGSNIHAESERDDSPYNEEILGGFTTVDLRIAYQIRKDLKLQLKATNIFDKEYELAGGYNTVGRTGLFTITYTPGI